jgi:hypothetical protein
MTNGYIFSWQTLVTKANDQMLSRQLVSDQVSYCMDAKWLNEPSLAIN